MLEKDLINHLLRVFKNSDKNKIEDYKELVMQALNNLSNGSRKQQHILGIFQTDFYEIIYETIFSSNKILQMNSLKIINNCISQDNFLIATKLIENGLIEKTFKLLDSSDRNFEKLLLLIDVFDSIFALGNLHLSLSTTENNDSSCLVGKEKPKNPYVEIFIKIGGIEKLDELQKIANEKIYNKTVEVKEKYFNCDDN